MQNRMAKSKIVGKPLQKIKISAEVFGPTTSAVTAEQNSSQLLPRYFPDTSQILPRFCTRVYVGTKTLNHRPYRDDLHRRRRRRRIDTIIATTVAVATTDSRQQPPLAAVNHYYVL